ncbi:MAG: DUF192 domain-containing protein [Acidimicrobiia bacterium]
MAPDPGDLAGWEAITVAVGEETLLVALADEAAERAAGLSRIENLGELDGMLFAFPQDTRTGFWMKDTLIALDIAFFGMDGDLVDRFTMELCEADPCPIYSAAVPFRWALETPEGMLGPLPPDARLVVDP